MSSELIINASLPEIRIALIEDAEVQELLIERAQDKGIVGNIYKGKVTRVLPGMQAAFVDIGLDKAAFLYVDDVYVPSEKILEEDLDAPHVETTPDVGDLQVVTQALEAEKITEPSQVTQEHIQSLLDTEKVQASDRSQIEDPSVLASQESLNRPTEEPSYTSASIIVQNKKAEGQKNTSHDRRIRSKDTLKPARPEVKIQDLLKEGQEVIVQVAKDAIATKGARLTCHISLAGRHLVCMPTIDHVGVSRRIEKEEERRRLRELVEKNKSKHLGFIVRTASGKGQSEKRVKQDIEYLTKLWNDIKKRGAEAQAPALIYEDLTVVLRAVRDWVTEETDKLRVDSKKHYTEILNFVGHFMPSLKHKIELYQGDIPIFDAYNISTELSRSLERKVWLKSGGYIVIDQAEALVAIDVNTGRFVGKKNLEDTILKTNLEAVKEIAYQLRLRNCGGIIVLDLIDMEKEENRHRVYRALEEHLLKDRARPTILKISELGLIEMTRKRTRDTLVRTLCESCSHCEGKGFVKSIHTVAYEILRELEREGLDKETQRVLVQAHSDVIDVLAIEEKETLDQMEKRYNKSIYLQTIRDFHIERFEISTEKKDKKKQKIQEEKAKIKIKPPLLPIIKPKTNPLVLNTAEIDSEEEDRLAFLRAQAAQDAALARFNGAPLHPAAPPAFENNAQPQEGKQQPKKKVRRTRTRRHHNFKRRRKKEGQPIDGNIPPNPAPVVAADDSIKSSE